MKTLYLECYSGISGDMTVAALLDLGASEEKLRQALDSLGVGGYHLHISQVNKRGITAKDFDVHLEEEACAHDHPHEHEHPHNHEHPHEHSHQHDHPHEHTHDHEHTHEHPHIHRNLQDVLDIIEKGALTPNAKKMAKEIFTIVAQAEGKVHGKPIDEVHFHEVGAIDSIVDIIGTAVCLDDLGIERVYTTPLYEGTGTVRCQHGIMPVPAPATAEIIASSDLELRITDNVGEMVTPTGAAIAAALSKGRPAGSFKLLKTGYGAGKKDFPRANVLRASLIEEEDSDKADQVVQMECNLDNMTGEQMGYAMERLLEEGALDVWFTPIQMKKNRPAVLLGLLCKPQDEERLAKLVFKHTGTIGLRRCLMERRVMDRELRQVSTPYGMVTVKHSQYEGIEKEAVEYDSAREAAMRFDVPIKQIYQSSEG